jgi:hypothetical protein
MGVWNHGHINRRGWWHGGLMRTSGAASC